MHFQTYNFLVLSTVCPAPFRFLNAPNCIPSVGCNSSMYLVFQTISLLPAPSNERRNFQHVSNPHFITVSIFYLLRIKSNIIFPLLISYQIMSPGPRLSVWTFSNKIHFIELLAPRSTDKMKEHPLSAIPLLRIQYNRNYPPYWRPFLHSEPEEKPWCGDGDPLITEYEGVLISP